MNRIVALTLLAASLALFGASVEAQAQSYTAPAGIAAQAAPGGSVHGR